MLEVIAYHANYFKTLESDAPEGVTLQQVDDLRARLSRANEDLASRNAKRNATQ